MGEIDALNIDVKGTVIVTSQLGDALAFEEPATIRGDGTINVMSSENNGIHVNKTELTIEGCTSNVKGICGIAGRDSDVETLTVRNAAVSTQGRRGSICRLKGLILDGSFIMQPAGAAFDDALHGVAQEGQIVTGEVVINSISTALNTPTADASVKLRVSTLRLA